MANERILSIQSHVAFGYVGGKAAVFPLQCLNFDVDVINTVNFSNHTGYGRFGGSKTSATELTELFSVMKENGVLSPSRLLTGYIPGAEALSAVGRLAKEIRDEKKSGLIYLLDPVLGDSGKLYVSPDVIPVYKNMLPLADIITPNWFEVQVLTGIEISDLTSLRQALRTLHTEFRVPNVVISSLPLSRILHALPAFLVPQSKERHSWEWNDYLICIASSYPDAASSAKPTVHTCCVPCIPGYFSGVGDLFSALVLGHFNRPPRGEGQESALSLAVSYATTKTLEVMKLTHDYARTLPEEERTMTDDEKDASEPGRKVRRMKGRELRLIQGQDIIRSLPEAKLRRMSLWNGFWDTQ